MSLDRFAMHAQCTSNRTASAQQLVQKKVENAAAATKRARAGAAATTRERERSAASPFPFPVPVGYLLSHCLVVVSSLTLSLCSYSPYCLRWFLFFKWFFSFSFSVFFWCSGVALLSFCVLVPRPLPFFVVGFFLFCTGGEASHHHHRREIERIRREKRPHCTHE